jgi:molybdate transport system substrate-binding protein
MTTLAFAASLLGLALAVAPLAGARAAELQVLAGGCMTAMKDLAQQFETATGHTLVIRAGTTPDLIKLATTGGPFDVAVVPREVFRDDAAKAKFVPGPTIDIARVGLGVAVRAGATKPDISSEAALKGSLLKAGSIATIPASAAGVQVLKLFEKLGIATETGAKMKALAGPGELVKAMAAGDAELGVFLINVLSAPGIDVVGPVPAGLSQDIVYTCGVAAGAKNAAAALAFIEFLQSPEAKKVFAAKGLTPS